MNSCMICEHFSLLGQAEVYLSGRKVVESDKITLFFHYLEGT